MWDIFDVVQTVLIVFLAVQVVLLRRALSKKDIEINEIYFELSNYERLDQIQKQLNTNLKNRIGTWIK